VEPLRIGSLFSGYGGLDLAAHAVLNSRSAWFADIKPASATALRYHYPDVPNHGDITRITKDNVEPVDVLTFGWPCQPFSLAGKRLGADDPRALWPQVARLVEELRPRILFGENVTAVCRNGELRRVVDALTALGYVGSWRASCASNDGSPVLRDRLFFAAVDASADPVPAHCRTERGPDGPPQSRIPHSFVAVLGFWARKLGRPCPAPTEVGPTGGRLTVAFLEWCMGLPEGWVTGIPGLSRVDRLGLLGNGVAPLHAEAVYRELLPHLGIAVLPPTVKDSCDQHSSARR
jgi:DNA (cytosine-5)-methyltransferase 1